MSTALSWGRHYVAVRPDHFRVDYAINPFMDPADQPDPLLAMEQWEGMVAAIEAAGAWVDVIDQRADAPDMVYAMNLGLALQRPGRAPAMTLSHMRHPERRMETASAADWFTAGGWQTSYVGRDGVGAHFEAGDAFAFGDALVVGHGPRTDELALKALATDLDIRVRGVRTTHPGMYHLDLAFCPVTTETALVCPEAFDAASAEALMALIPDPIVLTEAEALTTFAANSIVVGSQILMPGCPEGVRAALEARGLEVRLVDVSEFHKGGGSVRCLTNPVDVTLGRDLPSVLGGAVIVA